MKNKTFLILGSKGQLAQEFQKILSDRKISFHAPVKSEGNITDKNQIQNLIQNFKPDIIINCAAYNAVDAAEDNPNTAYLVNTRAVQQLADLCYNSNIFLIHYSSDYVFDGKKGSLYIEEDQPNPLNIYGKSKLEGELAIQKTLSDFLIFRLSWVIGPGQQNFLYKLSQWAKSNPELKVSSDEISVPTFTEDIVNVTLLSLEKKLTGLYHLTNSEQTSRYELAKYYLKIKKLSNTVVPVSMDIFKTKAKRPYCCAMDNQKISKILGIKIPNWKERIN
ncbi:dTDP-4-dehydrorhamnose reductase [hydrothermal vent metagenome]|uniref:dTDP-4-dehydrorhamnose reductase n=1 Tax=hydrothermal vent metagenome TaxID=652676 RepID=A0A3B1DY77_9ZZZZ